METNPEENPLMKPDHELPAPHDMQLEPGDSSAASGANAPSSPPPPSERKMPFPMWILPAIAFLLVLLAVGMYFFNTQKSTTQQVAQQQIPQVTPTPSPTPDSMANWLTYTNASFMFMYPKSDLLEKESETANSVSLGQKATTGYITMMAVSMDSTRFVKETSYKPCPTTVKEGDLKKIYPCLPSELPSTSIMLDGQSARNFYVVYGSDNTKRIIQTVQKPFVEILFQNPGITTEEMNGIVTSFKFIDATSSAKVTPSKQATQSADEEPLTPNP